MINILVIEDNVTIREIISYNLKEKYKIFEANSAEDGLDIINESNIDLVLLDWMLPEMSGISFIRTIKKKSKFSKIPVIFVSAKEEESDKIIGFKSGADDYITKPFSHKELLARVEAVLKRSNPEMFSKALTYDDIEIKLTNHKVFRNNLEIKLSPREYKLLLHFMKSPKLVFSREQLLDNIWGLDSDVELRTVDVHIRRLRKAINIENCRQIIRTVRATGYSLD